eukprot:scaffold209935_cov20-Tisochrysis_lutea.AAC.2
MANMRAELSSSSSALIAAQAEAARADGKAAAEKAALKEAEARHAARVKVGTPGKAVADKTALTEAQARHGARVKVIAAQGVGLLICITGVCFRTHSKAAAELVLKKAEAGMLRRPFICMYTSVIAYKRQVLLGPHWRPKRGRQTVGQEYAHLYITCCAIDVGLPGIAGQLHI